MQNRTDKRTFHYIYKITRVIDGKFYVGMHSTDNLEDGYFGSGKKITRSIKKHGKEAHVKEILEFLENRKSLSLREEELVCETLLNNPKCMNLIAGGEAFKGVNETGKNLYGRNGQIGFGGENLSNHRSKAAKTSWRLHKEVFMNVLAQARVLAVKAAQSKSAKSKRAQTFIDRGHMQGEKNSQFGTCWVTDGVKPVKIKKEQLDEYLAKGYSRGRK